MSQNSHDVNVDGLKKITEAYGLGEIIDVPFKIKTGIANKNYTIKTSSGEYVVKILVTQQSDSIDNDVDIQRQLDSFCIPCPMYLTDKSGGYLYSNQDIHAVVSKKIAGVVPEKITVQFCRDMGIMLGKFHNSVTHLTYPKQTRWLNIKTAESILKRNNTTSENLSIRLCSLIQKGIIIFGKNLPHCVIHGDFRDENVLVDSGDTQKIVSISDFEESEVNLVIVDLAMTILSICKKDEYNLDVDLINSTLMGYRQVHKLSEVEIKNIPKAISYVAGVAGMWLVENNWPQYAEQYACRAIPPQGWNDLDTLGLFSH